MTKDLQYQLQYVGDRCKRDGREHSDAIRLGGAYDFPVGVVMKSDTLKETHRSNECIVITGMSGLYPNSYNIKELAEKLYNKESFVAKNSRWNYAHPELCEFTGLVPDLERFDAQFFKVHYRLSQSMDSISRKVLEQAYHAIYDAGINPDSLRGSKVGVYVGSSFCETEKTLMLMQRGLGIAGCSKAMFANRISYWLNAKGPSVGIDDACCSSLAALQQAFEAIQRGDCEAAIVAGGKLTLHPQSIIHDGRIIQVCVDGKTKSFDENADGVVPTEAVNVLFLQKANDAKRIYAEVVGVKCEYNELLPGETGPRYGFYRSPDRLAEFLQRFYKDAGVPPKEVDYVEAFGSAMPEADKAELEALGRVFCEDKSEPLLVGSVVSNIGYSEAASGISAITKVLLGFERELLAANLHCERPRRDVAALREGRMRIVNEHQPFGGAYAAVNGFSVTGVNGHVLLRGLGKQKDPNRYKSHIPYLVTISGRQDTAVQSIITDLKSRTIDPEEIALLHNIHSTSISGHLGRGYAILNKNEEGKTISLTETSTYFDNARRPLWFVYSGMGSQWAGMGEQLMRIPVFSGAIERCRKVLEPKGVDIVHIITSPEKSMFDNILHSFVGIAAVQIGLTDVLTSLGIVPDMIIGHSVGELGCAYADGCLTAEEMILSAYSRGLVSVQTPFIRGSMAAVGIGYEQVSKLVPPEIEVACHNGPESCTISGPADKMRDFVAQLTAQNIFAKEVPCSNIAYHSRYIKEAGPGLLKYLKDVIKNPKTRSKRWLSTSVPQHRWHEPSVQTSSAEYHTNNLLSPVLFEETARLVPADAVLVEVAPHGLLQAILKRSLPASCRHVPLTRRGHPDNAFLVLDAIGKLYMEGYNPKIEALYPKVNFPVSRGTPMLSHLVQWAHGEEWKLPLYTAARRKQAAATLIPITVHDDEHKYLCGHNVRGKTRYPFSAALVAVWDTLAMTLRKKRKEIPVEFSDLHFYSEPHLHDQRKLALSVTLTRGTGKFEVMDGDVLIASGGILEVVDVRSFNYITELEETMDLDSETVYQLLHEKDLDYQGEFRCIHKINSNLTRAQIAWNKNWVTLLDGMLQLSLLRHPIAGTSQLHTVRRLTINVKKHYSVIIEDGDRCYIPVEVFELGTIFRCGGIVIEDVKLKTLLESDHDDLILKTSTFVPRFQHNAETTSVVQTYIQIVSENTNKEIINVLGFVSNSDEIILLTKINDAMITLTDININYQQLEQQKIVSLRDNGLASIDLVVVHDLISNDNLCQQLHRTLSRDMFLLNVENLVDDRVRPSALYRVICTATAGGLKLELLRWRPMPLSAAATVATVRVPADLKLLESTRASLPRAHRLVVMSSYPPVLGLKEIVKQWRKEADLNQIYMVMVSEKENLDQLPQLDLVYNVLKNGVWGGDYYTNLKDETPTEGIVALSCNQLGDLDSLQWVAAPAPVEHGIAVNVHYASINDIDVKRATGVIKFQDENDRSFGMDFSGATDAGERVMGVMRCGAVRSRVAARGELLWPVPAHWSLEDAATVPSAYLMAYYCLCIKSEILGDKTILVHGGAGALGQAVISVALSIGCEVFTTVSNIRKKRFLKRLFPNLKEDHIGNSRDASFGDMVLSLTDSKKCQLVISCVKGRLKDASFLCVGVTGVAIDLDQIPNQEKYYFGLAHINVDRHYYAVDFSSIFEDINVDQLKLQNMVSSGIARGLVRPLSRTVYSPCDVPRAFRLLAGSRHRGRAVVQLKRPLPPPQPRLRCAGDAWQVLVCHGDAFALALAERLVAHGARRLLLHCDSDTPLPALRLKLNQWTERGIQVITNDEDLSTDNGALNLLTEVSNVGPVEGIYVIANVMSKASGNNVNAKCIYTLDKVSRKLSPSIKNFVVINGGANEGLKICLERVRNNLPAKVLSLPMVGNSTKSDDAGAGVSLRSAVRAAERALAATPATLVAHAPPRSPRRFLHQILRLAGISIPEATDGTSTLSELGITLEAVPAISTFLADVHGLKLDESAIPDLTIQKIRALDVILFASDLKAPTGLGTFYQYVDPDELLATTELVLMPTLTNGFTMTDDEFDVTESYLAIIPGLEGNHARFGALCERLKMGALVLQRGLDHPRETIADTAIRFAEILLKRVKVQNNFYLLGYETGVMIALEVAAILEEHGLTGTVFLVGGGPAEIQAALATELAAYGTYSELQNGVAAHLYSVMASGESGEPVQDVVEKVVAALSTSSPWGSRVDACVRQLLDRVPHSAQYARSLIESAHASVEQARVHKPRPRALLSRLIVLHAQGPRTPAADLQRYSAHPLLEYALPTPLGLLSADLRVASIVNRHLDSDILNNFEARNLCVTYLLSAETFMTDSKDLELNN